jgi:hypothetical protein
MKCRTRLPQGRRQHGQGRRDAHAAADQHQRLVALRQHEVARWRRRLQVPPACTPSCR